MIKSIVILLFLFIQIFAQNHELCIYDQYLYFLPNNKCLSLVNKGIDGRYITLFSITNGNILREIPISQDTIIFGLKVSNDGEYLIIYSSFETTQYYGKRPLLIKKYRLNENRWIWEKEWIDEGPCLSLAFSEDSKQIICVTASRTLLIDSESGSIIKKSDMISEVIDPDAKYPRFALSRNGRYFAWWEAKYLTFSKNDESGFLLLGDFLWYGIKWLFYLGSIPQFVYVWDIYEDKLFAKIPIPYDSNKGTPAFTDDEQELLLGPYEGEYKVYSLKKEEVFRSFYQKESIYESAEERRFIGTTDYKVISFNKTFFSSCFGNSGILIMNYNDGNLLAKLDQTFSRSVGDRYAMSFSSDNKYFAVVTEGNKIKLYDTQSWKLISEIDDLCKMR